jgi:hypothetical protein
LAKASARKPPHTSIEELEENATIEEKLLEPGTWEADWKDRSVKENATFWDRLTLIPKHAQHEMMVYLYRLEPRVYNKQGDPSYQAKCTLPLTIEQVQEDFGGGRYEAWLKRGNRTLVKHIFSISGQPRYKEGQTDATGKALAPTSPVASEPRGSDLSEALKAIVPLLKNDNGQKAADASIEVMKSGMTTALKMQSDAAGAPNELLAKLVDRALTQPQGPDALTLLDRIISISKNLVPQSPAQNPDGIDALDSQMGLLERLSGKKFSELLTPEGRAPKIDPWVGVLGALVQVLPVALREISQMQERRMQWQAHFASKGITFPPPPNLPANVQPTQEIPPPAPLNQPAAPADQAPPQPTLEQITAGMVNEIVRYRRGGWDGHACAAALAVNYAEVLPMLAPMLTSREQVEAFIVQTPALSVLINEMVHPEAQSWEEFVNDFFWTLNPDQAPDEDSDESETVEPSAPAEPIQTRRTRKKKSDAAPAAVGRVV